MECCKTGVYLTLCCARMILGEHSVVCTSQAKSGWKRLARGNARGHVSIILALALPEKQESSARLRRKKSLSSFMLPSSSLFLRVASESYTVTSTVVWHTKILPGGTSPASLPDYSFDTVTVTVQGYKCKTVSRPSHKRAADDDPQRPNQ